MASLHVKEKLFLYMARRHNGKRRCCHCVVKLSILMKVRDQFNVTAVLFLIKRPLEPTEQSGRTGPKNESRHFRGNTNFLLLLGIKPRLLRCSAPQPCHYTNYTIQTMFFPISYSLSLNHLTLYSLKYCQHNYVAHK